MCRRKRCEEEMIGADRRGNTPQLFSVSPSSESILIILMQV